MKKISLVLAAILATSNVAVAADSSSNFGGFRASVLGDYSFLTVTQKGGIDAVAAETGTTTEAGNAAFAEADRVVKNNAFGKLALNLGYTKVMSNNILIGASILGGWDFSKITGAKDAAIPTLVAGVDVTANNAAITATRATNAAQLSEGEILAGSYGLGANVSLGYVVMPKVALRIIGEGSTFQKKLSTVKTPADSTTTPATAAVMNDDATALSLGFAVGAAVDVAVSDRIVLTLGGKYNVAPTKLTFTKEDNKALVDERSFDLSSSWNIFAEVGFRVTQD